MTLISHLTEEMAGISVLRSAGCGCIPLLHHAAAQLPVSLSLSTRTFRNGPSRFSVFAQSQDFSTRLQELAQTSGGHTSINTGPRGALRLAQGIQAVIGVGSEWVADASKGAELAAQEGKSAAALAACRTLAEELTELRFPAPRILAFKEGSSQARYFVSRLIPAHKDPPYEQEARFPQLRTLSGEERTKLKSSFVHFDDPSFCEWMRNLKVLPPQPT